jgi:hypothetical protein
MGGVHPGDAAAGMAMATQVRSGSCCQRKRAISAVSRGDSASVINIGPVVSVSATMKAVHMTPQPRRTTTAPPALAQAAPQGQPICQASSAARPSALAALRQKVTSKEAAESRWRVTTPGDAPEQRGQHHGGHRAAVAHHGGHGAHALSRAARLRSCSLRWRLRRRIDLGVISTSSSSSMNSTPYSSVRSIGGVILIASSC